MNVRILKIFGISLLLLLAACASQDGDTFVYSRSEEEVRIEGGAMSNSDPIVRQRILADMLYEAQLAFEDNRLMTPPGNNAYDGFRMILDIDPENVVAQQGIRDIVLRYVELADAATQLRQYDNAENFLNRAARIDGNNKAVADARDRLERARNIQMDIFTLDGEALTERSLQTMVKLGEIGQHIRNLEATFLINARTDEEGRWIYKIMREAVGGYRLRGNIGIAAQPSIQVVVPES